MCMWDAHVNHLVGMSRRAIWLDFAGVSCSRWRRFLTYKRLICCESTASRTVAGGQSVSQSVICYLFQWGRLENVCLTKGRCLCVCVQMCDCYLYVCTYWPLTVGRRKKLTLLFFRLFVGGRSEDIWANLFESAESDKKKPLKRRGTERDSRNATETKDSLF